MADETLFIKKSSLTQIADAVRTKGGTTEPLAVPDGIVKAVGDIPAGGGGLNFHVVSGEVQPQNPKENTLWIKTTKSVKRFELCVKLPKIPDQECIYIAASYPNSSDSSVEGINILEGNVLKLNPQWTYNIINGKYILVDSQLYADGKWKPLISFLYDKGFKNTNIGAPSGGMITEKPDFLDIKGRGWYIASPIDLSPFKKLKIIIEGGERGAFDMYSLGISENKASEPVKISYQQKQTITYDIPENSGVQTPRFKIEYGNITKVISWWVE